MRKKGCTPRNAVQAVSIQAGLSWVVLGFGLLSHAEPSFPGRPVVFLVGSAAPSR